MPLRIICRRRTSTALAAASNTALSSAPPTSSSSAPPVSSPEPHGTPSERSDKKYYEMSTAELGCVIFLAVLVLMLFFLMFSFMKRKYLMQSAREGSADGAEAPVTPAGSLRASREFSRCAAKGRSRGGNLADEMHGGKEIAPTIGHTTRIAD